MVEGTAPNPLIRRGAVEPRLYQESLLDAASRANTLVVAPTALGKTVVAVLLAALKLTVRPEGLVVVMAPTRPLVAQHAARVRALTTLAGDDVAELSGMTPPEERARLWGRARLVCSTPQAVQNDVLAGRAPLARVSLMVFDECHRAVGDHPYVFIAERYRALCDGPHVLALTAAPGSDRARMDEVCSNLSISRVEVRTEQDADVRPYVKPVEVEWRRVELPEGFARLGSYLEAALRRHLGWLAERRLVPSSDPRAARRKELVALQARLPRGFAAKDDAEAGRAAAHLASSLKLLHALELLETQGVGPLERCLRRLEEQAATSGAVRALLEEPEVRNATVIARHLEAAGVEHPKLEALVAVVRERLAPGSRAIVFTQYRDTVGVIAQALAAAGVSAERFVGHAGAGGLSQRQQLDALARFGAGAFQVLVATSVAEEGLDVPQVDLVVLYEPVPSAVRAVQRRGRTGRSRAGLVVGLIASGTRDEGAYEAAVRRETDMASELAAARASGAPLGPAGGAAPPPERPGSAGRPRAVLYVDSRETSATLVRALVRDPEVEVRSRSLAVADFLVSDDVAVERKSVGDFLQSLVDGRLLEQARRLAEAYPVPLLVLEGGDLYGRRNIHPNAIRGAIAALSVDLGVGVVPTRDESDTAAFLLTLAKREQAGRARPIRVKGKRRAETLAEQQELVLCSLRHINRTLARRLLERFGSVAAVLSATEAELREVAGIGRALAGQISRVGGARYERPDGRAPAPAGTDGAAAGSAGEGPPPA